MAELPSNLIPYIHSYLVGLNLHKTAKALKKETTVSVEVPSGPGLIDFYQLYLESLPDGLCENKDDGGAPPKKKRKKANKASSPVVEEPALIASPTSSDEPITDDLQPETPATFPIVKKKSKKNKQLADIATPFRRVGDDVSVDPRLQDNSFEAKDGSRGSWGEKANRDLKFTKGRSFRHEKTKKKRGSYKGGAIDTQVYSIKFDD